MNDHGRSIRGHVLLVLSTAGARVTSSFDVDGVKELSALGVKVRDRVPAGDAVLLPVGDVAKEAG